MVEFFGASSAAIAVIGGVSFFAALRAGIELFFGVDFGAVRIDNDPIYRIMDTYPDKIIDDQY